MLPAVIRFNSLDPAVASVYENLSRFSGFAPPAPGGVERIGAMVDGLNAPARLINVSTRGYKSQVFAHRQLPPEAGKSLDLPPAVLQKMSGTPTTPRFRRGPNAGQTGAKPGAQSTPSRAQTDR